MLVFIHINKTAGRTIRYILRSSFGTGHCEVEPWHAAWTGPPFDNADLQRLRKVYGRLESIGGHRIRGHIDLQDSTEPCRYFTFVRDPLKTCASRFQFNVQYRGKKDLRFEEWIQRDWPRNAQTKMIAGCDDAAEAIRVIQRKDIFVGLTEQFDESLVLLKKLVAPTLNISYRPVNVARDNSIAKSLLEDPRTRAMLVDANRHDLQLYDYVTQERVPDAKSRYGDGFTEDLANYRQRTDKRFNERNIVLSRLKQYGFYKPALYLYRTRAARQ